jgi:hypothetical protein
MLAMAGAFMACFDVSDGRLRFRRTTRGPVREWLDSPEGEEAARTAAREVRFALLGRARAGKRQLTRKLWTAITSQVVREALAAECEHFLDSWTQLAYAPALPRLTLDGRRLVVVPRTMIAARSAGGTSTRLGAALGPSIPDDFKAFFGSWVLRAMNDAIRRAAPDAKHPVHARESWACVHVQPDFVWVDPSMTGESWRGHVVMFELPSRGLRRRERHALVEAIAELGASLPGLARGTRDSTVRLARDQMASLRF